MILTVLSAVFIIVGIAFLFGLTPERVTDDLISVITPNDSLRDKARNARGNKKKHALYRFLMKIRSSLTTAGKSGQFVIVCCASVILFAVGVIVSLLIGNPFLIPAVSVAFALIPFFYITSSLSYYEKQTKEELETSLSIISTSYIRSNDIVSAVKENLQYIKPPLKSVFMAFVGEATAVSSNTKRAILNMKDKIDDSIFDEWCDTLLQCQDDGTQKDTLLSVVAKLSDVRLVNSELKTMLSSVRNEYWVMVALVVGNVPLLYFLNKDWYHTLLFTLGGKFVCGLCGIVILITALFMLKFTKPVEYKN